MRVLIAATIAASGLTTTGAHADLGYYIDQAGFRQDDCSTLLDRARLDVGRNAAGWSHRWCGRQMAMWVGQGPNLARDWARYGRATTPKPGASGVMNGHVGVVKEVKGGRVILVSGNHAGKSG